jgi:hypothetical protein
MVVSKCLRLQLQPLSPAWSSLALALALELGVGVGVVWCLRLQLQPLLPAWSSLAFKSAFNLRLVVASVVLVGVGIGVVGVSTEWWLATRMVAMSLVR